MSVIKILYTCILVTSVSVQSLAQVAEKTLIQSINIENNEIVTLDVPSEAEITTWSKNYVRVEMKISIAGHSSSILKSLIATGRYRLNAKTHKGNFVISATGLKKTVTLRGKEINDLVTYSICSPENVVIKQPSKKNSEQGMVKANML